MSLNDTLDRLAEEREARENQASGAVSNETIRDLAERIFFQRMLNGINPGMGEPKIEAMIDRSIMIATKLYDKLYKS